MAVTATATKITHNYICHKLGMSAPIVISESPNKPNIKYIVKLKDSSVAEMFTPFADELKANRTATPRTIIFTKTYEACGEIYFFLKMHLGKELTELVVAPNDLACFRLVDIFTACIKKDVKDEIIRGFCSRNGTLCIVD